MRKLTVLLLLLCLVIPIGCASTPSAPAGLDSPAARAGVDIARTLGRSAAIVYLGQHGVPATASAAIFEVVDPIIDGWLNDKSIMIALTPDGRQQLVEHLATAIVKNVKVSGQPVVDQGTAEVLAGQIVDGIVSAIRAYATPPTPAPVVVPATST